MPSTVDKIAARKRDMIIDLTRQCFDIQYSFKTTAQLDNLLRAMTEDLFPFELSIIEQSFKQWRQSNEKIPTPAGILKILHTLNAQTSSGKTRYVSNVRWIQVVYNRETDEILEENQPENRKSSLVLDEIYSNYRTAYRRDPPL